MHRRAPSTHASVARKPDATSGARPTARRCRSCASPGARSTRCCAGAPDLAGACLYDERGAASIRVPEAMTNPDPEQQLSRLVSGMSTTLAIFAAAELDLAQH